MFDEKKKNNNNEYYVEEEKLKTVFSDEEDNLIEEDKMEQEPQKNESYQVSSQLIEDTTDGLSPISVSKEMRTSFLEYAMSVIVARALPDARDGLKPVHRRILYGLHELGITSSSPHKKSARIVGDVLGKYHPHGDSAVYFSMVRMAQDFSMRYPLVDGHGNFGSIDGDEAAAMRYTEARMSKIAGLMVDSLRKDTVDFIPNYDNSDQEPKVLPSRIPNLLVSGGTGIAVGMATNIPPHNLSDTIDAIISYARNQEISIEELMDIIKAPDFPTGGIILGLSGVKSAYKTGRGSIKLRSKTTIEELKNGKHRIIVHEIPYLVNKSKMIEKIADLVKSKAISGISDLRDESSREGIRVVIEIKRDFIPEVVLNKLFKYSQLQSNFSVNFLALNKGEPKLLNLKEAIKIYLDHQIEVVSRRTQFDLTKAEDRAHILKGLQIAITNIDEVIKIIRKSANDQEAQKTLQESFELSDKQTKSIIDMRLSRLTGLAIGKMNTELEDLVGTIEKLQYILNNHEALINLIIKEMNDIREKFTDGRRTQIIESDGDISDEDLIPKKDIAITLTNKGYVKRIPLDEYRIQRRGGVGSKSISTYADDDVKFMLATTTHIDLLIFTSFGKVYRLRAHQIPEMSKQSKGVPFINIINIDKDEKIISMITLDNYLEDKTLVTVTKKGIIKKTKLNEFERINKNGKIAFALKENDMLFKIMVANSEDEIIIASANGRVVRFDSSQVRSMGRKSFGVRGIRLNDDKDFVVGAGIVSTISKGYVLAISKLGFGKKTLVSAYRKTHRGSKGVKTINVVKAGQLQHVEIVKGEEDLMLITKKGITVRTKLSQVSNSGRDTKGVKIITLQPYDKIESITIVDTEDLQNKIDEAIHKTQEISLDITK